MSAEFDQKELQMLFAAMSDGTLSDAELARLETLMATSEEARKLWYEHNDLEVGLADWAALRNVEQVNFTPVVMKPKKRYFFAAFAAAVALIMISLWWWRNLPTDAPVSKELPATGVAVLTQAVGVSWSDGMERTPGMALPVGALKLLTGAVLVEFYSGARVVLEGPADLELLTSGKAFLRSGKLSAHVPTQAKGFTIQTPGATVIDHGTDFGVIAGGTAPSEVHVFSGNVEVARENHSAKPLKQGEAVRLQESALEMIPSAPKSFLSEEELALRRAADSSKRRASWLESSRRLSGDVGTRVHFVFDDADRSNRQLLNHTLSSQDTASIVGSPWSEGRWAEKLGLEFRGEGDRVRMSLATPMQTVSLLAWIRVESLPHQQNVILSADSEQTGALHWHVTERGELRLEIARDLGRARSDWEAVNSAPFVLPARFGQWVMLVTTFDGSRIRHYGNGRLIGEGASFTPASVIVGTAEIGNWGGGTQRHLAGTMDEFAILSRVLTDKEILDYYEQGKP